VKSAADAARFRAEALAAAEGALGALDVANDTDILLAAGLHGRPGIALIVGTGSHCLGRSADGAVATCGGWGYLMDDCGSGYALGRAALRAAVRMWDGRLAPTLLAERVRGALGLDDPADALHRVYDGAFGVEGVAALAPLVTAAAADGDEAALGMLRAAAGDAAELVAVVHARLGLGAAPEVVLTGSVALHPLAGALLVEQIRARVPGARVAGSALPPVAGAVVRAAQAAGLPLTPDFLAALAEGTRSLDAA
jgi:N-acetylglucosamine kinase-like BadF-type ATPase